MVLMPGPGQISWKALRAFFKQNRLTLADDEEVLQVTGYRIGTVNPFGLPQPVQVLIDQALLQLDEISLGSGLPGTALIIKTADLLRGIPAAQAGCFAVDRPC